MVGMDRGGRCGSREPRLMEIGEVFVIHATKFQFMMESIQQQV